jgi:signal transduction histidine kinase
MNKQIKQLTELQKEMADTVCHDIKTPLARLKFIIHSANTRLSPEQAAQIQLNLQEIEQNVYDYLRLAQQDFRAELNLTEFDLNQLLQQIVTPYLCSTEHQIILPTTNQTQLIRADRTLLSRAVNNLLVNALAYCQHKVWIETEFNTPLLSIRISDDGQGATQQKNVNDFIPEHHGLGLAIVRRVAQQHEGQLEQQNNLSGGATFILTIKAELQT